MKVLKFGGSSLATPERIVDVGRILLAERKRGPIIGIVSAFGGVTNQLLACAQLAERGEPAYMRSFDEIENRHRAVVTALLGKRPGPVVTQVGAMLTELRGTLEGIQLLRHCPPRALDMTASFGERLSAAIVAAYLDRKCPAQAADARDFVVTDDHFTQANVDFGRTNRRTRAYMRRLFHRTARVIPVATGFIGATSDGHTTTIG